MRCKFSDGVCKSFNAENPVCLNHDEAIECCDICRELSRVVMDPIVRKICIKNLEYVLSMLKKDERKQKSDFW